MRLAFCLFEHFPHGGLQRNMLAIAGACRERGHEVVIWTRRFEGEPPAGVAVRTLPVRAWTNHGLNEAFHRELEAALARERPDLVVGFNKMPGLDVYYAADTCFATRALRLRGPLHRMTPRHRRSIAFERAVFGASGARLVLALSAAQIADYRAVYDTPAERFVLVPPGIATDRRWDETAPARRRALRDGLGLERAAPDAAATRVALFLGSDYRRKGLDRVLVALEGSAPKARGPIAAQRKARGEARTVLLVAGRDRREHRYVLMAQSRGVDARFLGARDDVPDLLFASDVLVHPAREENTGNVLLEAGTAGLPTVCSAACGWADLVARHELGLVLPAPFAQEDLDAALSRVLAAPRSDDERRARAERFLATADVGSRPQHAAAAIEALAPRTW